MADPRQGRSSSSGYSPKLGSRDPRLRANQSGLVGDADLDQKSINRDGAGRTRFSGFDQLKPLASSATLAEVIAAYNQMLAKGRGQ